MRSTPSFSKSTDAISAVNSPLKVYYKGYIADRSEYVYQGANLGDEDDSVNGTTATATGFTGSWTPVTTGAGAWNQLAQGVTFNAIGSVTYSLSSGARLWCNRRYDGNSRRVDFWICFILQQR